MVATTHATAVMCGVEWEIVQKVRQWKRKRPLAKMDKGMNRPKLVRARISVAQYLHAEMWSATFEISTKDLGISPIRLRKEIWNVFGLIVWQYYPLYLRTQLLD